MKPSTGGKPIIAVQKHEARHLHYDLRLEMDGVLKSWAIPKEPPLEAGVRRLAVQTENHPLDYAFFEGVIPKGQYGAGRVEVWDRGTYTVVTVQPEKIIVDVQGSKLKGIYCLIKFKPGSKNWIFFKKKN